MIALTGANGFVGGEIIRQASSAGVSIRGLSRGGVPTGAVETHAVGDLGQALSPELFRGCDAIIHCAARAHIMKDTADDRDAAFLRANCDAAINVAETAVAAGVRRFVFVSSIKVLGERTHSGAPFRPGDAPAPLDPYGRSKAAAERELRALAMRSGMQLVIVRPPLVHGPGARGNLQALVALVRRGIPLPLAAITNRRSLVALENLADLLLLAAVHPLAAGEILHAADPAPVSTREIIEHLAAGLGVPARLFSVSPGLLTRLGRWTGRDAVVGRLIDSLEVDASRSHSRLGWEPSVTTQTGLVRMGGAAR